MRVSKPGGHHGPEEASSSDLDRPTGVLPQVRPVRWFRPWLLGAFYAAALLPLTVSPRHSANVISRYMTIEAIVEQGTLAIERTPMTTIARPVDMVRFGHHFYSDKPPVLAALAAPIYGALCLLGVRFTGSEAQFVLDNLALTWLVVGTCSALTLVWLRRIFQALPIPAAVADLLTLGFGFGSQLLAYAVTFNNHSVAAALITGSMALTLLEPPGSRAARSRFGAGLLVALAATIDLPAGGVMLASLGTLQLIRCRSLPWSFLGGAVGPLLLHAWLQSKVTGTPLPVEMYPAAFEYPGSYWTNPAHLWREHGPRWRFGLELLVGPQGWLTVTPVLAFGLVGMGLVLVRRRDPLRPMAWAVLVSSMVLVAYYTWGVRRTDFGGQSFGTRHLLAITPPWFLFAVVALERLRWRAVPVLFVLAMGLGGIYAIAGAKDPWSTVAERSRKDPWLRTAQWAVIYPRSQNLEKSGGPR
jgi:hypothetical protein